MVDGCPIWTGSNLSCNPNLLCRCTGGRSFCHPETCCRLPNASWCCPEGTLCGGEPAACAADPTQPRPSPPPLPPPLPPEKEPPRPLPPAPPPPPLKTFAPPPPSQLSLRVDESGAHSMLAGKACGGGSSTGWGFASYSLVPPASGSQICGVHAWAPGRMDTHCKRALFFFPSGRQGVANWQGLRRDAGGAQHQQSAHLAGHPGQRAQPRRAQRGRANHRHAGARRLHRVPHHGRVLPGAPHPRQG